MTSAGKFDILDNYNSLFRLAQQGKDIFPDDLCNFLVSEFEYQSAALFKVSPSHNLVIMGKSSSAKKSLLRGAEVECKICQQLDSQDYFSIHSDSDIGLQISEFVIYEIGISFNLSDNSKGFLKIAQKTSFSQTDTERLKKVIDYVKPLLARWSSARGGNTMISTMPFSRLALEIANELRSSTNSIIGSSSILSEDNLSISQGEYVTAIKKSAQNLLINIKDFIDLAKLESEGNEDTVKLVNLGALIKSNVDLCKTRYSTDSREYTIEIDDSVPKECNIDENKLKFVLSNILVASTILTPSGKISIRVKQLSEDKLQFIVSDNGNGISEDLIKRIFDPFVITQVPEFKGSGLTGLSFVLIYKYIKQMGGEIRLVSRLREGSTFNFSVKAELQKAKGIEAQLSQIPKPTTTNNILVVEDDYATSKLLSNYLNKWGYKPTIVNSEDQIFSELENEKYLAIIMDIELPEINGLALLKKIHDNPTYKNIPVIACSVEVEEQKAFMMGAVEYFVKPINYNYLVEVLTSYKLRKNSNVLCVDDDLPTLNLVKQAIETAGFNAVAENISANVMELIKDKQIDLAIVDLDMPHPNGFELIKLIKSDPKFAKLPIIIYTGKENYQEDIKKIDGMFEYLLDKRSTNIEDLADTINSMINRYEEPTPVEEVLEKDDKEIKILFAEDYKHSQIIVTRLLKKNGFENVVVVENGEEAYNCATKDQFDLVLMDMQMPIMNGFEATEKIREMENYKDTPIIALTAFAMKGDKEKCLDAGATDYIPKPIDSKEFIEKVKYYTNAVKQA